MDTGRQVICGGPQGKESLAYVSVLHLLRSELLYESEVAWQVVQPTLGDCISHYREHLISIQDQLVRWDLQAPPELRDAQGYQIAHLLYLLRLLQRVLIVSNTLEFLDHLVVGRVLQPFQDVSLRRLVTVTQVLQL